MKKQQSNTGEENVKISINKRSMVFIVIVVLGIGGICLFLFIKYNFPSKKTVTQKMDPTQETAALLAKINTLYDLPSGESPTIATVSDKTKLQNQPFFAKAENGDKVLIYTNAKKAILYRPSINKIMEVASLAFNTPTDSPKASNTIPTVGVDLRVDPTPAIEKIISMSIYNGTKIAGLAATTEKKITEKYKNIEVMEKSNATKDYKSTIVIDITGNNADMVKSIADLLGGTVAPLPPGEKTPKGEILVIMGK